MNRKQEKGWDTIHKRVLDAAKKGNLNETMTLLNTIKTDYPGELYRGFDLFLWDHLIVPTAHLMNAGADARPKDRYQFAQYSALSMAAQGGHSMLVKAILTLGLAPKSKAVFRAGLQGAVMGGDVDVVELLLDYGIDINTQYPRLLTALELSILHYNENMTKFLLTRGAKCTPFALVEAALYGRVETLRLLLAQGCDVNAHANMNLLPFHRSRHKTPLEVARKHCPPLYRNTIIQILLDAGARS